MQREHLISSINRRLKSLTTEDLTRIENSLTSKKQETTIPVFLYRLLRKAKYSHRDVGQLASYMKKNWKIIKENKILSKALINHFEEIYSPQYKQSAIRRMNYGSSTGKLFEDLFALLLQSYLWSQNKHKKYDLVVDKSITISGLRRPKRPDILIHEIPSNKKTAVVELKTGFTKSSLIRTYEQELSKWQKLNPAIHYYFVILTASKLKSKTYKKIPKCRVICNDLKLSHLNTRILDDVESILEDILCEVCRKK